MQYHNTEFNVNINFISDERVSNSIQCLYLPIVSIVRFPVLEFTLFQLKCSLGCRI